MTTFMKWISGGVISSVLLLLAWCVTYPSKSSDVIQSAEAAGSVAVDKIISALEERVGKTDVALEHYKTAHQAKRQSLVDLKTLQRDTERKAAAAEAEISRLRAAGDESAAALKEQEKAIYDRQKGSLAESAAKAEKEYKEFTLFIKNKKLELDALRAQANALRSELSAMGGGDAAFALQRAKELEDEVRSTCSRLEAEMEALQIDQELE